MKYFHFFLPYFLFIKNSLRFLTYQVHGHVLHPQAALQHAPASKPLMGEKKKNWGRGMHWDKVESAP